MTAVLYVLYLFLFLMCLTYSTLFKFNVALAELVWVKNFLFCLIVMTAKVNKIFWIELNFTLL